MIYQSYEEAESPCKVMLTPDNTTTLADTCKFNAIIADRLWTSLISIYVMAHVQLSRPKYRKLQINMIKLRRDRL